MSQWQDLLASLLDGESLDAEEATRLNAALSQPENQEVARQWIQFQGTLIGCTYDVNRMEHGRERLHAKAMLRHKHAEVLADTSPSVEPATISATDFTLAPQGTRKGSSRYRNLMLRGAAVIVAALILIGAFWTAVSGTSYAAPTVKGDFHVLGESTIHKQSVNRGDRIVSGGEGAQINLGKYCQLTLTSHSEMTILGAPHQESVELHQGRLQAHVIPNQGQFGVQTPLGTISVIGTEFETIVEYPNGMPGDLSMSQMKKVLVTVAVLSGTVLCDLGNGPVQLTAGSSRTFADEVIRQRTVGEVTTTTESTVTLKTKEGTATFHVGENPLTRHEAESLLKGDRVTIVWDEEGGQQWIRDIEGEGLIEGTVTRLGDAWVEVRTSDRRIKLRAPWRGGNPADGGGPDKEVLRKIGGIRVGDKVSVRWAIPEGKRVMDVRLQESGDMTRVPAELYGFSGRVIGRLVSRDVEQGELKLKIIRVDRVWRNNEAKHPTSAEGRTLKIDGVFGKFLDVLLTLKKNDGVQIEVKHVRGDGLTFLGEDLRRIQIKEEQTDKGNSDSPPGLNGFRGILIGELVSKDIEKGTLQFRMEKVQRVWKANKAPAPEQSKGKVISVEGISGKFLDTLLVLEIGTRIEVEAFQVRGPTLRFLGEWLRKAE